MKRFLFPALFLLLVLRICFAGTTAMLPGTIPLSFQRPPALDLIYNNKILLPSAAMNLYRSGVDLSELDPQVSDIWKREGFSLSGQSLNSAIPVRENDLLEYIATIPSRSGNFRFNAFLNDNGTRRSFSFLLGKKVHNVLLRQALLAKIGYAVTPIKFLPRIKLIFGSPFEKENFLTRISEDTFADNKRWVIENIEGEKTIILQDVLVMPSDDHIYNLSLGYVPASVIRGRRVLNALLVPFALVNIPESVNLFPWNAGTILDGHVRLDYDASEPFSTPYEDARWVVRLLADLDLSDWKEIAENAMLPHEVETLVFHKMIARRNDLVKIFKIKTNALSFDSSVSEGDSLVDGKLMKENWEGYASRFSWGDPDSPLSASEIFSFFKSKFMTNVLTNLVEHFNLNVIPHSDLRNDLMNRQMERAYKAFEKALLHGDFSGPEPVALYSIPVWGGALISSREIVAGSYMGTDNMVQLVDSVGLSANMGAYFGTDLVTFPWSLSGSARAALTRTYSHLRPVKSIKMALKTPLKNIFVPFFMREMDKILSRVNEEIADDEQITDADKTKKLEEILAAFKENLGVGESLVITDTIGVPFSVTGAYQVSPDISAYVNFKAKSMLLSRLHIYRRDEHTIQIYKDLGGVAGVGLTLGLKALIPVIRIGGEIDRGKSITQFYSLDLSPDENKNPSIFKNIQALRSVLMGNSLELLKAQSTPYRLKHSFKEKKSDFSLLVFKWKGLAVEDLITVCHPKGDERYFYRRSFGDREGVDFENTVIDYVNYLIGEIFDNDDIVVSSNGSGNPGDTYYGRSYSRNVFYESEVENLQLEESDSQGNVERSQVSIVYNFKGWKTAKKKMLSLFSKLNKRYNFDFYPENLLNDTTELELYNVRLFMYFYQKAFMAMASLSSSSLWAIFQSHVDINKLKVGISERSEQDIDEDDLLRKEIAIFGFYQKKYLKALNENDIRKIAEYSSKMASKIESLMDLPGILKMVGGEKNFYAYSRLDGFRRNDENGDQPYVSNAFGLIGDSAFRGPVFDMQEKILMTESEFFNYWIQDRL